MKWHHRLIALALVWLSWMCVVVVFVKVVRNIINSFHATKESVNQLRYMIDQNKATKHQVPFLDLSDKSDKADTIMHIKAWTEIRTHIIQRMVREFAVMQPLMATIALFNFLATIAIAYVVIVEKRSPLDRMVDSYMLFPTVSFIALTPVSLSIVLKAAQINATLETHSKDIRNKIVATDIEAELSEVKGVLAHVASEMELSTSSRDGKIGRRLTLFGCNVNMKMVYAQAAYIGSAGIGLFLTALQTYWTGQ